MSEKIVIRDLLASEIECRVLSVGKQGNGFSMLLYKDARCDMAILDETFGCLGWKREHSLNNHNCTVSVYDSEAKQWVGKEDTGTESNTEQKKGLASDSFKRACFNWGIGRELYTAPFVWISNTKYINQGKVYEKFRCYHVKIENKVITELGISDSKGVDVFQYRGVK